MYLNTGLKRHFRHVRKAGLVTLLVILLALPPVVNLYVQNAKAATLSSYSVKIDNSQSSATSVTYGFLWTTSATTDIKQIDIQVCTTPSGTCNAPAGFSSGTPTLSSDNIAGTG